MIPHVLHVVVRKIAGAEQNPLKIVFSQTGHQPAVSYFFSLCAASESLSLF